MESQGKKPCQRGGEGEGEEVPAKGGGEVNKVKGKASETFATTKKCRQLLSSDSQFCTFLPFPEHPGKVSLSLVAGMPDGRHVSQSRYTRPMHIHRVCAVPCSPRLFVYFCQLLFLLSKKF